MIEYSFSIIVVANSRFDNAKSPAAMLQEKTAQTPHTLRVAGGSARCARSHTVRTHMPLVGYEYLFSSFDILAVCTKEKGQHGTAARKNNENETEFFGKKKNPRPLM